jgi:anaerobic selenocysteine-containing dehydrogenase
MISAANNVLMGYANQKGIYDGLKNLELFVVYEHFMTPTAQLADYILPGTCMLERPLIANGRGGRYVALTSRKLREAPGECKEMYYLYRELAIRMGFGEYFPWETVEDLLDYRVQATGMSWEEFSSKHMFYGPPGKKTYRETGFATPSGKVELYSSILEDLGYDPLPYYSEPPHTIISDPHLAKQYPLPLFVGVVEPNFYLTNGKHIKSLREKTPYPKAVMHRSTGEKYQIFRGQWIWVETPLGRVKMQADFSDDYPPELVSVPHGWWLPELHEGEKGLSGVWEYSTSVLLPDDDETVDLEQGVADMRGER